MNKHTIYAILGTLVSSLFGVYVLMLFYSGKLNFYIHPRYTEFALLMSWIAISFGVVFLIRLIELKGKLKDEHHHEHAHEHHEHDEHHHEHAQKVTLWSRFNLILGVILITLPLVLGFLLPVKTLSVITAQQRLVDLNGLRGSDNTASLFLKNTKTYSLGDWIKVINNNPDLNRFAGKEVKVSGFVFSPEGNTEEFLVSRFIITCCAVDARPLGITVIANWQQDFSQNQWVEVQGIFELIEVNGQSTLRIKPSTINLIAEPSNPYVF